MKSHFLRDLVVSKGPGDRPARVARRVSVLAGACLGVVLSACGGESSGATPDTTAGSGGSSGQSCTSGNCTKTGSGNGGSSSGSSGNSGNSGSSGNSGTSGGGSSTSGSGGASSSGSGGNAGNSSSGSGGSGTGGDQGSGGSSTPAADAGPPPPTTPPELIDDLEDGDGAIYTAYGRQGRWYAFNDGKGQASPGVADVFKPASGGATSMKYAVHTTGTGFTDYGGGVGVELNDAGARPESGLRKPFDASAWDGITFMVKGKGMLRLNVPTVGTAPTTEGGMCAAQGSKACNDSYGTAIPLTSSWTQQTISFAQLAQQGYGVAVSSFNSKQILGLLFQHIDPKSNWDIWIDDVKFYSKTGGGQMMSGGSTPVTGTCTQMKTVNNGSVTWYELSQGTTEFHCGNPISGRNPDVAGYDYTGSGKYFGAMNTSDYASSAACGACVEVTRDGSKKITVTITDECPVSTNPKCKAGHIDLSHEAFRQLGSDSEGYLGTGNGGKAGSISWKYVPCPVDGKNIGLRLKEGTNKTWNQVLVEGTRYPLSKVEVNVNGNWVTAARQSYNFWEPPSGNMGSYEVRATDIHGSTVTSTITLKNGDQDGATQFPVCK